MAEIAPALIERFRPYGPELDERIMAATIDCIARWGLAKTTLDDIARAAGCSRATVYRTFPGGKDSLLGAVGQRELERLYGALGAELSRVDTLEEALVVAVSEVCRVIAEHAAFQYLLHHELEVVLPYVAFDGVDPLLQWSGKFALAHLTRFLTPSAALELGEWVCRIVVSYGCDLDGPRAWDLTDVDEARSFVRTFVLPGIDPADLAVPSASSSASDLFSAVVGSADSHHPIPRE